MTKTLKSLSSLIALSALATVEHDGVKYGPGHPAGTDFEASEAEAALLLQVKAVKLYDANATTAEDPKTAQAAAIAESAAAAIEQARSDSEAAATAQEKADADAKAASEAQAKVDLDAQAVAEARAKLEADIKAFEATQAAAKKK